MSSWHPFENDLSFLYGTIFTLPPIEPGHHTCNVCIFAEGEVAPAMKRPTEIIRAAPLNLYHTAGDDPLASGRLLRQLFHTSLLCLRPVSLSQSLGNLTPGLPDRVNTRFLPAPTQCPAYLRRKLHGGLFKFFGCRPRRPASH